MSDLQLLLCGSAVMSVFLCGCYVHMRRNLFDASAPSQPPELEPRLQGELTRAVHRTAVRSDEAVGQA